MGSLVMRGRAQCRKGRGPNDKRASTVEHTTGSVGLVRFLNYAAAILTLPFVTLARDLWHRLPNFALVLAATSTEMLLFPSIAPESFVVWDDITRCAQSS